MLLVFVPLYSPILRIHTFFPDREEGFFSRSREHQLLGIALLVPPLGIFFLIRSCFPHSPSRAAFAVAVFLSPLVLAVCRQK